MARNIEVLRNYFLGKDPQLKETMSDNSLRLCGIQGKYYVLRTELMARLKELRDAMDAEDLRLQGEIDDLNLWKDNTPFVLDSDLADALSSYYTKTQIDNLLSVIPRFGIEVVEELPTEDISETTIYMVPSSNPETENAYDEFIYVDNAWEQIGTTAIDMSNYYTKDEVNAKTFTTTLTADVHIPDNAKVTGLTQGWYFTGTHKVYFGNSLDASVYENALFYFYDDGEEQWFDFLPPNLDNGWLQLQTYLWFDTFNNIWVYGGYDIRDSFTSISDQSTDSTIPTSKAVYDYVEGRGSAIKEVTAASVRIWNLDDGIYHLPINTVVYYNGSSGVGSLTFGTSSSYLRVITSTSYKIWSVCSGNLIYYGSTTLLSGTAASFNYSDIKPFTGTDGVSDGAKGLVPAPTTTDNGKFLCADGTWTTAGGGGGIQELKGTSGEIDVWTLDTGVYKIVEDEDLGMYPSVYYTAASSQPIYHDSILVVSDGEYSSNNYKLFYIYGISSSSKDPTSSTFTSVMSGYSYTSGASGSIAGANIMKLENVNRKVTSIDSSSTDLQYPSAKCVYDGLATKQNTVTYSTTDLTPGVSPLNDGELYFVYE